jgi:TP901 family phage tail tape measure protein
MATTIVANLQLNTTAAQRQLTQFNQKVSKGLGQPLGRISGDAAEFQKSLSAAAARVSAFGAVTGVLIGVSRAITGAAQATVQINKDLVELNTFLGQSTAQVNKFGKEIFSVAKRTASDFKTVAEAAKEFARQGLSTQETLERTNSALILSRISGLGFAEAVTSITTAINTFNKSAIDSEQIVNKLIAVDTRFAVSSNQIAQALSRVGSSAQESGLSLDQLIATVTAVQQVTGRGGSVIGNSLKTIFTRIRRPEVIEQLQSIGVTVKDQNGALLDGITVLQNYANATKNLSQIEKSRTAELLGGVFQINQLQAIIRDLTSANSIYASSLKISENASDDAIKKNNQLNQSYSALFARTKTNLTELGGVVGDDLFAPLLAGGANAINTLANFLKGNNELPEALGESLAKTGGVLGSEVGKKIVGGIGRTLATAGPALAGIIASGLVLKIGGFAARSVAGLGRSFSQDAAQALIGKKRIAEEQQILNLVTSNKGITDLLNKGTLSILQAETLIKQQITGQNQQLANQLALANQIASRGVPRVTATSNIIGQSVSSRATVTSPKIPKRSGGYIPAFAKEEAQARGMGAINPKAGIVNATIGAKSGPVIVNSQEKIFNVGGQTAIVPNYRSLDKVPNFAKGKGAGIFKLLKNTLSGNKVLSGQQTSSVDNLSDLFQQLIAAGSILPILLNSMGASSSTQFGVGSALAGVGGLAGALRQPKGASLKRRAVGGLGSAALAGLPLFATGAIGNGLGGSLKRAQNIQAEEDRIADEFNKSTTKLQDLTETLTKLDAAFTDASSTPDQLIALSKKVNQLTNKIALSGDTSLAARVSAETSPEAQLELIQDSRNRAIKKRSLQETILKFEGLKTQDANSLGRFLGDLASAVDTSDPDSMKVVADFFNKQSEDTQNILRPAFSRSVRADLELSKLKEKTNQELTNAGRSVNKKISELRVSAEVRSAREKSFESAIGSAQEFSSLFGKSAGINFKTRASTFGATKKVKKEFFNTVSASGLDGDIIERIKSMGPSEEAGALLKAEQGKASAPVKSALSVLIDKNNSLLSELEKSNKIAEQDAEVQRKILNLRERISFGGGIESSLSGSERAKAINAPLKGALQFRLGGMMGSRRSQVAGLTNFLSAIEDQVPGATERSPGLRGVRERLTGLRQADMRTDLLRNAKIAGGLGLGDVGSSLSNLANNPSALRNIASAQSAKALPGGQAPDSAVQFLNQSLNDYVSGLSQKLSEDRSLKQAEVERIKIEKPILDSNNENVKAIFDTVKSGLSNVSNIVIANPGKVQLTADSDQNRSKGFIPSFANPLREAIGREKQFVPASSIRVNQSSKLINRMNPTGLAVTNTIDEPNGLASIGLASGGFVPNFSNGGALFGPKVAKNIRDGINDGNTLYYDRNLNTFHPITKGGAILWKKSIDTAPKNAKIVSYTIDPLNAKRSQNLLNIEPPGVTKLNVLNRKDSSGRPIKSALPAMPKSILLDKLLSENKGKPAQKLLREIEDTIGGKAVVKTAFGSKNYQSKGVFGHNSDLGISDIQEIRKRFYTPPNPLNKGSLKTSGFFAEAKLGRFGEEFRVHIGVDERGVARVMEGGTIVKSNFKEAKTTSALQGMIKAGFSREGARTFMENSRKMAEKTALQNIARLVRGDKEGGSSKFKRGSSYFFGTDVSITDSTSAQKAGVVNELNSFKFNGQNYTPFIHEINESAIDGSSGLADNNKAVARAFLSHASRKTAPLRVPLSSKIPLNQHSAAYIPDWAKNLPSSSKARESLFTKAGRAHGKHSFYAKRQAADFLSRAFPNQKAPTGLLSKLLIPLMMTGGANSMFRGEGVIEKLFGGASLTAGLGATMQLLKPTAGLGSLLSRVGMGGFGILGGLDSINQVLSSKNAQLSSKDDLVGAGLGFADDALLAFGGGPIGKVVGTARASYRAGNLMEEFFGVGENLANTKLGIGLGRMLSGIDGEEGDLLTSRLKEKLNNGTPSAIKKKAIRRKGRKVGSPTRLVGRAPLSQEGFLKKHIEGLGYTSAQAEHYLPYVMDRMRLSKRYSNFSSGFVPNFSAGAMSEMMDVATNPDYSGFRNATPQMSSHYPNVVTNSAEIEVPATEVYNRMGFFGAKPKNPAQQYAILNPAQQASLGYAAEGFVPNFAMEQFASAIGESFQKAFSPYSDKIGASSNTSNVINISDQRSYQENSGKIDGVMEFLYKQFPKEMGKFGAVFKK